MESTTGRRGRSPVPRGEFPARAAVTLAFLAAAAVAFAVPAPAARASGPGAPAPAAPLPAPPSCAECHEEVVEGFPGSGHALLLRSTRGEACAACHGPATDLHPESGGTEGVVGFSKMDGDAVASACVRCHAAFPEHAANWAESEYNDGDTRCVDCHRVHGPPETGVHFPTADGRIGPGSCRVCHAPVVEAAPATIHAKIVANPHLDSCETCHGSGEAHLAAVREGLPAPEGFRRSADCLLCHRHEPARHAREMPAGTDVPRDCSFCHRAHLPAAEAPRALGIGPFATPAEARAAGATAVGDAACSVCHATSLSRFRASRHDRALRDLGPAACETCHGPASVHLRTRGSGRFIVGAGGMDLEAQKRFCLECHAEDAPDHAREFAASPYAKGGRTCATCHRVHAPETTPPPGGFTSPAQAAKSADRIGSEACARCHEDPHPGLAASRHGPLLAREGRGGGCESCHGPGGAHAAAAGKPSLIVSPARLSPKDRDDFCLSCHRDTASPAAWTRHPHGRAAIGCASCHDPFAPPGRAEKDAQPALCAGCHGVVTAEFRLPNHHPVGEGGMKCSDCHDMHRPSPPMRTARDLAARCADCHRAEAGVRLFPHEADRADGCVACHEPHGSTSPRLLRFSRVVDLCLSCHIPPATHDLGPGSAFASCLQCHAEIHGSDADRHFFR